MPPVPSFTAPMNDVYYGKSTSAVFLTAFMMFATHRPSLHALEPDLRLPSRFRGLVGRRVPSVDTVGRVYAGLASDPLRDWLAAVAHLLKRNKALPSPSGWYFAAFDGHELFASRKRCCSECETRTVKLKDREVTEYYHRIVACHLIGHELAVPLDAELVRHGEGEETAAKRLMERVCARYGRLFDVVCGDALYLDAPFLRLCRKLHKHAIVVIKGDQRLLLQDAAQLFSQRPPEQWTWPRRTVQYWDEEGFTSCEGFDEPLRVLRSVEAKPASRNPSAPFMTSTLQMDASRKLGFSASRTMQIAQRLSNAGRSRRVSLRTGGNAKDSEPLDDAGQNTSQPPVRDTYRSG